MSSFPTIARYSPRKSSLATSSPKVKEDLYRKVLSKKEANIADETKLAAEIGSSLLEYATELEKDLELSMAEIKSLETAICQLESTNLEIQSNSIKMATNCEQLQNRHTQLELMLVELKEEKKDFVEKIKRLESEVALLKSENSKLQLDFKESSAAMPKANHNRQIILDLKKENQQLLKLVEDYNFQLQIKSQIANSKNGISDQSYYESQIAKLESEMKNLENINCKLVQDISEITKILAEYQKEERDLNESGEQIVTESRDGGILLGAPTRTVHSEKDNYVLLQNNDKLQASLARTASVMTLRDARIYVPLSGWLKTQRLPKEVAAKVISLVEKGSLNFKKKNSEVKKEKLENIFKSVIEDSAEAAPAARFISEDGQFDTSHDVMPDDTEDEDILGTSDTEDSVVASMGKKTISLDKLQFEKMANSHSSGKLQVLTEQMLSPPLSQIAMSEELKAAESTSKSVESMSIEFSSNTNMETMNKAVESENNKKTHFAMTLTNDSNIHFIPNSGDNFIRSADPESPLNPLMAGSWMFKCPRSQSIKLLQSANLALSKLHKRFFWLNPFSKTLFWAEGDSSSVSKTKHVGIKEIKVHFKEYPNLSSKSKLFTTNEVRIISIVTTKNEKLLLIPEDETVYEVWIKGFEMVFDSKFNKSRG